MIIPNAWRKDLGTKSCCWRRRNLTAKFKAIIKTRSPWLLNHLNMIYRYCSHLFYEKKFVVDEVYNYRNTRVIDPDSSWVPSVMQSKHPASVMVFGAVARYVKVIMTRSIEADLKINTAEYMKIPKEALVSWIKKNYDPVKVMCIQDSAPAHVSNTVQNILKRELLVLAPWNIWHSCSPDLYSCSFFLWEDNEKVSLSISLSLSLSLSLYIYIYIYI